MLDPKAKLEEVASDLERSKTLPDYEAVNVLWVAIVKMANLLPGESEHRRMIALCNLLTESQVRDLLADPAVDELLHLKPPLESVLANEHECLKPEKIKKWISVIRDVRGTDPRKALDELGHILKQIRNKREHGFKTSEGPRDGPILSAAVRLLRLLSDAALLAHPLSSRH